MRRFVRRVRGGVRGIGVAAALLATGCSGDRDVWDCYRAERLLWNARRLDELSAVAGEPSGAAERRAAGAFEAVVSAFPPARWATGAALQRPRARRIAQLSGTAALLRARLDQRAGRDADAERELAAAAADYVAVDSVSVAARAARAVTLERLGRSDEAIAAWSELSERAAEPDSDGVAPWSARAFAALEAMRLLRSDERAAAADSLGQVVAARLEAAAAGTAGGRHADELWDAVASIDRESGRWDAAKRAIRSALAVPNATDGRPTRVLQLTSLARAAGEPDTAQVYATWAMGEFAGPVGIASLRQLGHAWEEANVADSALSVYKRLIEQLPAMGDLAARARLDRARLLDRMGRWEAARAELRALATMQPTHPCGEAALIEIVRHHVREGEAVFATVETKHAMDTFDQLLATQGNTRVRLETLMAKAEVWVLSDRAGEAERTYAQAWHDYPHEPAASHAGWSAARLADSALRDTAAARALYQELSARAEDLDVRQRARRRLRSPAGAGGTP